MGVGETVQTDPVRRVGQSKSLEGCEDVGAGRDRCAAFGQESVELLFFLGLLAVWG